jgi:hypothetical protein
MPSDAYPEPANDSAVVAFDQLAPLAPPSQPLFLLQLVERLEKTLVLKWECPEYDQSGEMRLPAGEKTLLCPLPDALASLGFLNTVEVHISAAFLEDTKTGDLEPLELWRRFATFALWSETGHRVSLAGSHGDPAKENALFVTLEGYRVAVDFEQLARLRLRRADQQGVEISLLTIAPCLYS